MNIRFTQQLLARKKGEADLYAGLDPVEEAHTRADLAKLALDVEVVAELGEGEAELAGEMAGT